jgi:hypothetical protein
MSPPFFNVTSVFKPKDEEPYGRLNPKVCDQCHLEAGKGTRFPCAFADYEVDTSAVSMDHPIRSELSHPELEVRGFCMARPLAE